MKILIVRLSAMGDVIHGLPVAANASAAGGRVAWLTDERYAPLLEGAPFLDRLFVAPGRSGRGAGSLLRLRRSLREWAPDVTIDVQGLWKSAVAARLARAPVIGFSRMARREPYSAVLCQQPVEPAARLRHIVDRNLSLLEAAGIPVRQPAPDARFLLAPPGPRAAEFLAAIPRPFALYHPGSARPEKAWGEENFASLARLLRRQRGLFPVISWGPGDSARVDRFRGSLPEAVPIPALDYRDLAGVVAASALFVAGDTGPLHLADALGATTLGLYGPTDPARNGPYRRPDAALRYNLSTPVEAVAARALELLRGASEP
ncbi:MAG: glycosyltransferase family 9 protein [Thermoanaerobaculia bacterium]